MFLKPTTDLYRLVIKTLIMSVVDIGVRDLIPLTKWVIPGLFNQVNRIRWQKGKTENKLTQCDLESWYERRQKPCHQSAHPSDGFEEDENTNESNHQTYKQTWMERRKKKGGRERRGIRDLYILFKPEGIWMWRLQPAPICKMLAMVLAVSCWLVTGRVIGDVQFIMNLALHTMTI